MSRLAKIRGTEGCVGQHSDDNGIDPRSLWNEAQMVLTEVRGVVSCIIAADIGPESYSDQFSAIYAAQRLLKECSKKMDDLELGIVLVEEAIFSKTEQTLRVGAAQ